MDSSGDIECENERASRIIIVGIILVAILRQDQDIPERPPVFT